MSKDTIEKKDEDKVYGFEITIFKDDDNDVSVYYSRTKDIDAFTVMWNAILHADDVIQKRKQWKKDREEYLQYLDLKRKYDNLDEDEINRLITEVVVCYGD